MRNAASTLSALLLTACGSVAYGPSVLVLPGSGKTYDQFRFDEQDCRAHAQPSEEDSAGSMQQRFDRTFVQCMYAKGHKVPVSGRYFDARQEAAARTPPPPPGKPLAEARTPPPPPAGKPPADAPPDFRTE